MEVMWFLPTSGADGRHLGSEVGGRPAGFDYLRVLAQAVDSLGFAGALLPTGRACEESWIVAATLAPFTRRMKFLVAFRPGLTAPALAARTAASLDRASGGRVLVNIVTGGSDADALGDGLALDHAGRYAMTDEFLTIWRRLLRGETVDFAGEHLQIAGGRNLFPPVQQPYPPLYFGGSSEAGIAVAAKHADVYLTWGEPPAMVREKIAAVREAAARQGRSVRFGIRLHIIVRESMSAAWDAADDLIKYLDDDLIADAQRGFAAGQSVGQARMAALHGGRRDALEVSPNLWAGIGLVRGGAGTALVGDPATVAARMEEYAELGIDSFILSGYPHLEEAYRTAELLFPLLPLSAAETGAERPPPAELSFARQAVIPR